MRYNECGRLREDAQRVSNGVAANQSQESLDEQLRDLHTLANRFGLYDAADWIHDLIDHRKRYARDYGSYPAATEELEETVEEGSDSISLEQAVARINIRKQTLDHIYEGGSSATAHAINAIREDELDHTLEILQRVKA